jgi:hypothetical protein
LGKPTAWLGEQQHAAFGAARNPKSRHRRTRTECDTTVSGKSGREMLNLSLSAHGTELANWDLRSRVGFLRKKQTCYAQPEHVC